MQRGENQMKRLGKIGRMLLLPTLCLPIVLLAGCGQKSAEMNTIEVLRSNLAEDDCILVIPPSDSDYDTRIIFAPGTEVEAAKESVLAAIPAVDDEKSEDTLTSKEAEAAVRKLGFDSLTEMRMQEHSTL